MTVGARQEGKEKGKKGGRWEGDIKEGVEWRKSGEMDE